MIGTTLSHYRVIERIGAGGMGVVYRAHDERLDRDVAIKVLPEEVAGDPDRLARFEREAKALAALSHPNVATVYGLERAESGSGTGSGSGSDPSLEPQASSPAVFLVMELLEGESLRQRIPAAGLGWQKAVEIGAAVADGLAAAHGKGIVHRDLKPENIFITSDGRVKILDFGLAQIKEPVEEDAETATMTPAGTVPGTVMGTVGYMSPEQVRGQQADARSDIFALGCVLYEMLTGRRAFSGETTADTQAAILKEEPASLAGSGAVLPANLDRTVRRCLEKSPEARFQSAADLAYNLRSITPADVVPMASTADGPRHRIRSIALLPLANLTGDPDQLYFVDGLHEELIATFAQISAFEKVIARTSVMGFRDAAVPIREIGERLGVDGVLEGSVRQAGDIVRVTLQLIDARTEDHLWADSFNRDFTDILALQSEVAVAVAREVEATLTSDEQRRLTKERTVNKEVYRLNLQAVRLSPWFTSEDNLEKARVLFEKAIGIDPTYAESHLGLSRVLLQLAHYHRPPGDLMPKALSEVEKALELDPDLSIAHSRLGSIRHWWQWDLAGAEAAYRRGIELNPNGAFELARLAELLAMTGRPEEAVRLAERAVELDPLNVDVLHSLGWVLYLSRRFDEGIEQMSAAREAYPNQFPITWSLASNYSGAERFEDAFREFTRCLEIFPAGRRHPTFLMAVIWAHMNTGRTEDARGFMNEFLDITRTQYVPDSTNAMAHFSVGDTERAIEFFQKAFAARESQLIQWIPCAIVDPLRTDARFRQIVHAMGLEAYW